MITLIEDYFSKGCGRCERFDTPDCSTKQWQPGLENLRRLCLETGLQECVKWGHPCYMHQGRNIVVMGAFRNDFRLSFFNAALLKDGEGVLERSGPNTQHPDVIRFMENAQVAALERVIVAYLKEAMEYAEAGIKPSKDAAPLELPLELVEAFECDPQLAGAFHRLTPGRQKSYAIALNAAKKPETRVARIAKFRENILAGKGALDR